MGANTGRTTPDDHRLGHYSQDPSLARPEISVSIGDFLETDTQFSLQETTEGIFDVINKDSGNRYIVDFDTNPLIVIKSSLKWLQRGEEIEVDGVPAVSYPVPPSAKPYAKLLQTDSVVGRPRKMAEKFLNGFVDEGIAVDLVLTLANRTLVSFDESDEGDFLMIPPHEPGV